MKGKDLLLIGGIGLVALLLLKPKETDGAGIIILPSPTPTPSQPFDIGSILRAIPQTIINIPSSVGQVIPELNIPEFTMPDINIPEVIMPDWDKILPDWSKFIPDIPDVLENIIPDIPDELTWQPLPDVKITLPTIETVLPEVKVTLPAGQPISQWWWGDGGEPFGVGLYEGLGRAARDITDFVGKPFASLFIDVEKLETEGFLLTKTGKT